MFRLAKYDDIKKLSKLRVIQQKDSWKEYYRNNDEELYLITKKYLEEHLNNDIFMFLEIEDNIIIATCGLQIVRYLPQCAENGVEGYICNVFTLENYRRKGIQINLINECIKFAKSKDISILRLTSDVLEAIELYKKLGFEHDKYMMQKEIK